MKLTATVGLLLLFACTRALDLPDVVATSLSPDSSPTRLADLASTTTEVADLRALAGLDAGSPAVVDMTPPIMLCPPLLSTGPRTPSDGFYHCYEYDADVGGFDTCCGGSLRVQICGGGLACDVPAGSPVGACVSLKLGRVDRPLCIDRDPQPLNDCRLEMVSTGVPRCDVIATCGNHDFAMACHDGICDCNEYAYTVDSTVPDPGICHGSSDDALAFAKAKCGFPENYNPAETIVHWTP